MESSLKLDPVAILFGSVFEGKAGGSTEHFLETGREVRKP